MGFGAMVRGSALALMCVVLLEGCGGGGSAGGAPQVPGQPVVPQAVTVGGVIDGLGLTKSITLSLNGGLQSFEGRNLQVDNRQFTFQTRLEPGDGYTVAIELLPLNQLCTLSNGIGTANESVTSVTIRCVDTLLNDTGVADGEDGGEGRDPVSTTGTLAKLGGGRLGFDFVKVCGSGQSAGTGACPADPAQGTGANEWACTRDVVQGVLWQRATGAATGYAGAEAAVTAANDGSLCGVADWRLPAVIELTGLVDNGAAAAETAIDTDFFPGTAAEPYWSGEGRASDAAAAWAVEYDSGAAGVLNRVDDAARTRVVSGTRRSDPLELVSDTIFTDMRTALTWLTTGGSGTWSAALDAANAENSARTGGFTDWRLPNRNELGSLVNRAARGPAIDDALGGSRISAESYWSSTPLQTASNVTTEFAWVVDFDNGDILPRPVTETRLILLVRSIPIDE